ncbi:MAG: D-alanyl-D-alanine carboxypeptidase family protein [Bacilli bacterium]
MKKIFNLLLIIISFSFVNVCAQDFEISAENVILYNLNDNTILYEKNSDEKVSIASITKIMTSIVALENIDDLNDYVTITLKDFNGTVGYSKAGFNVGDKVTYEDLLYGILLPSGAEAVNAIVNNTLGYDEFIKAMNDTAKKIGLENTSFENPIGKDNVNNYSTVKDVAKMLEYALKNSNFKKIFTTKEYVTTNGINLNSTLMPYKNILNINLIDGSKSGFTSNAGRCLASISTIDDVSYLLVVLNSSLSNAYNAVKDSITIYDYYSNNYSYQLVLESDKVITSLPIKYSKEKEYDITSNDDIKLYLKNDTVDNLTYEFDGVSEIKYNTKKDTYLGTIKIYNEQELLYESEVFLNKDITYYNFYLIGLIVFIVIVILLKLSSKKRKKRKKRKKVYG